MIKRKPDPFVILAAVLVVGVAVSMWWMDSSAPAGAAERTAAQQASASRLSAR